MEDFQKDLDEVRIRVPWLDSGLASAAVAVVAYLLRLNIEATTPSFITLIIGNGALAPASIFLSTQDLLHNPSRTIPVIAITWFLIGAVIRALIRNSILALVIWLVVFLASGVASTFYILAFQH